MTEYFVFDVESAGLYGQGFAFGYTVVNESGEELDAKFATAGVEAVETIGKEDKEWLHKNVPHEILHPQGDLKLSMAELKEAFRNALKKHKNATIVADCGYPVEAKWLSDCNCDVYPLHELGTALLMCGMNPTGTYPRTDREKPKHHPLADARQSARIWIECLKKGKNGKE